ncbi:peptide/nickel transport system substrate-binding protein [Humitalea rosea]|uniref:Peptide/nickel transport system substrate-binding protein n=1 Tax=Humitalea rosea TaxID=990373 RepID=A0A2W7HUA1_9PROT|nr:ABC transporter substrate-binding protein [Humitalea rosea]PZW37692.1 peptide/nickel transport system substrate-binding protein [Humitalea rosea]
MSRSEFDDLMIPGLSRRTLLGAGALGVASGLLPRSGHAQVPVGAPRKGGVLRFCRPDPPDTLDPQMTNSFSGMEYSQMVYDNLVSLDADTQPVPMLATAWTPEKGGLEWLVTLREGVRFHSGVAFTSADVVATVERAMDPARSGVGSGAFGPVASITAEGPHAVRFVLRVPFGEFPVQLAFRQARILPAAGIDDLRNTPNGTGPFVFKEFQPGSSLTVERNPNYWNPDVVHLDGVRMVFIRESVSMQAALRGGQVDLLTQIPVEMYLAMSRARGFKAYSEVTGDYHAINIMGNMAPFDNLKVREAFRYILDRKATVASVLFGQGAVGNDVPLPAGSIYLPEMTQSEQDLPRAKRLIEESGVGPIELDFFTSSDRQPAPKMVLAFSQAASQIGVTLRVRDIPYTEYAANVSRKKPLYTSYWSGSATLFDAVHRIYHSQSLYNYSKIESSPGLDAKLDAMIAEVDLEKRKAVTKEVMRALNSSADRLIPYFRNYLGMSTDKVQGFVPPRFGTVEMRGIWLSA